MHRIAIALLLVFAIKAKADTENESPKKIRRRLSPYMKMFVRDAAALTKNKAKIDLGRTLFYDKHLSATSSFSCNACHDLEKYGTNGARYTTQREAEKTYRDVEFQRGLITLAPIDRFLQGDDKALDPKQLRGGRVFDEKGCVSCHTGATFGGQMIIKLGVTEQWPNQSDQGLFTITKDPKHKMAFRVSSLRNIAKTAPYFHGAKEFAFTGCPCAPC